MVEAQDITEEVKHHWWLVSYAWIRAGSSGYGNYTHGTTLKMFDNGAHSFAKERIQMTIGSTEFVLTSVSYLGEMTKVQALGETQ